MSTLDSDSLSLTPQQKRFLDDCVASGRFASAAEVLRAGLRLLADEEQLRQAHLARARQMIQAGAEELERGEGVDADAVFRRLQGRRERMRRAGESD